MIKWQWYQQDHMQTICTLLQSDDLDSTSSLNFYRLDPLADAQPTMSKQRKHPWWITIGRNIEKELKSAIQDDVNIHHVWKKGATVVLSITGKC